MKERVRIKKGWEGEYREGDLLVDLVIDRKGQRWSVVQWDNEDDPNLHKRCGIEKRIATWRDLA